MCVLGCLDGDLTLLGAALQEIIKVLGTLHVLRPLHLTFSTFHALLWLSSTYPSHTLAHTESGVDIHLHSSCITALQTITLLLKDNPQVVKFCNHYTHCKNRFHCFGQTFLINMASVLLLNLMKFCKTDVCIHACTPIIIPICVYIWPSSVSNSESFLHNVTSYSLFLYLIAFCGMYFVFVFVSVGCGKCWYYQYCDQYNHWKHNSYYGKISAWNELNHDESPHNTAPLTDCEYPSCSVCRSNFSWQSTQSTSEAYSLLPHLSMVPNSS